MRTPIAVPLGFTRCYHRSSPLFASRPPAGTSRTRPFPDLTSLPWKWPNLRNPYLSDPLRSDEGRPIVSDVLKRVLEESRRLNEPPEAPNDAERLKLLLENNDLTYGAATRPLSDQAAELTDDIWMAANRAGNAIRHLPCPGIPDMPEMELLADLDAMLWLKANEALRNASSTFEDGRLDRRVLARSIRDLARAISLVQPTAAVVNSFLRLILPSVYFRSTSILLRLLATMAPAYAEACWHAMYWSSRRQDPFQVVMWSLESRLSCHVVTPMLTPLSIMAHPFPQADQAAFALMGSRTMGVNIQVARGGPSVVRLKVPMPDILLLDDELTEELEEWIWQEVMRAEGVETLKSRLLTAGGEPRKRRPLEVRHIQGRLSANSRLVRLPTTS